MIESKYLQDNIENIRRLLELPTLRRFETRSLGRLLQLSRIREYGDGEEIIREGDRDPWLYVLLSGRVRILKKGQEIGRVEAKGELFGEMRLIDAGRRSASAVASGRTVCLAVNTAARERLVGEGSGEERLDFLLLLHRIFAEYLAMRLRVANEELAAAKKRIRELHARLNG